MTIQEMLRKEFTDEELEVKVQATNTDKTMGMAVFYVQARAIQNRLDEVFGFDGWKTEYKEINGGFICALSVRINGEWITKEDGAEKTEYEAIKGGISNAFKRVAASGFGIGRYLYQGTKEWYPIEQKGKSYIFKKPESIKFKYKNNSPVPEVREEIKEIEEQPTPEERKEAIQIIMRYASPKTLETSIKAVGAKSLDTANKKQLKQILGLVKKTA